MNRRTLLSFFGLAPTAPLFEFRAASADASALGCNGFLVTESAVSSDEIARLSKAWSRLRAVDLEYLERRKFTVDEVVKLFNRQGDGTLESTSETLS